MRMKLTLAAAATILIFLLFPLVHVVVAVANFIIHLLVLALQLITSRLSRGHVPRRRNRVDEPFVSIHVPAHNEPPEVLKETLRSLHRLAWENYEVLVIDNNTRDEAVWRPVEEYCATLGSRFRFLHVEGLSGAKAGAMNWARPIMNPEAEFIFVVDADYVVEPHALEKAVDYFTDDQIGLVQFPQEYRNIGPANLGLALDFKHFFAGYMNMANRLGCVPSTGTLSMIRVRALEAVNGFDTQVVTEDADLGFRLNTQGYRSVYAPEVIGSGLMPHDLDSLKKQRWRWAFGNAQILKLNWRQLLLGRDLSVRQKLGYLVHLTAWFNFNLIPSLTLILLAPVAWLERMHPIQPYLVVLAGFTLTSFMVLRFGTLFYGLRREGHSRREVTLAFLSHLGMDWVFSLSWLKCLIDHRSPFVRTNKFISAAMPRLLRTTLVEASFGLALLVASVMLAMTDFIIGPVAALVVGSGRFLVYWVWWQTRTTWQITVEMAEAARREIAPLADVGTEVAGLTTSTQEEG